MLSDSLYSHSCLLHDRRGGPQLLGSPEIDEILLGDRRRVIIIFSSTYYL